MTIRHDPAGRCELELFATCGVRQAIFDRPDVEAVENLIDPTFTGRCWREIEALPERRCRKRQPHTRCLPIVATWFEPSNPTPGA